MPELGQSPLKHISGLRTSYVESSRAQGTASEYVHVLSQTTSCPRGSKAIVDEVLIANTLYTIDNTRCHRYVRESTVDDGTPVQGVPATIATSTYRVVDLATADRDALKESKRGT